MYSLMFELCNLNARNRKFSPLLQKKIQSLAPESAMAVSFTNLRYLGRRAKNNGNKAHPLNLPSF